MTRVTVKRKLPLAELKIPPLLDGIPTNVIEGNLHLVKLGGTAEPSPATAGNVDPFAYSNTVTMQWMAANLWPIAWH